MSGFGFGGFDFSNISENFGDIGDRLQKLREDVEQTIDASLNVEESNEGDTGQDESMFHIITINSMYVLIYGGDVLV